jgi:hypothetical protein
MELNVLFNSKLIEIKKSSNKIDLRFLKNNIEYKISYRGFLIETEISSIDQKVSRIDKPNITTIKTIDILRYYNLSIQEYYQIFINFEGNYYKKIELLCIIKNTSLELNVY